MRFRAIIAAVFASVVVGLPGATSAATFQVVTHTFTSAPDGSATADYNASGTGASFSASGTSSSSGTAGTTGTATSAHDQSVSYGVTAGITSTAQAAADLASGSVHLSAIDNATCNGACVGSPPVPCACGGAIPNFASEEAIADLSDRLHFTLHGANSALITVNFTIDGKFVPTSSYAGGGLLTSLQLGGVAHFNLNQVGLGTPTVASDSSGWVSGSWITATPSLAQFQGTYQLNGPSVDLALVLTTLAQCGDGMTCNFLDTGSISLGLPSNVSFTSDSGVFLTAAQTPLPAALPLFATGLGGLGLLSWRRNRKARAIAV